MPSSLSNIAAKDGAAATIAGGVLAVDKSGAGTGPFFAAQTIVDTQGVNTATVKAASTAAVATDTSVVVSLNPNTIPAVTQSGTWTVQPGNTANTTAWKMQLYDGTTALPVLAGSSGAPAASAPALAVSLRDVNPNGSALSASSAPVVIASDQVAIPIKGSALGGATNLHFFSGTATTAVVIKASAGTLYGVQAINTGASPIYMKIYNLAAASVVVGTTVPLVTIPIPTTATTGNGIVIPFPVGIAFSTAISYNLTGAAADADTSAPIAGSTINVQVV